MTVKFTDTNLSPKNTGDFESLASAFDFAQADDGSKIHRAKA